MVDSGVRHAYPVDDDRRHLYPAEVLEIAVACFSAEAPADVPVTLDWEHDECTWHSLSAAAGVLRLPEVSSAMTLAVRAAAGRAGSASR